jgi:hypothetical protein
MNWKDWKGKAQGGFYYRDDFFKSIKKFEQEFKKKVVGIRIEDGWNIEFICEDDSPKEQVAVAKNVDYHRDSGCDKKIISPVPADNVSEKHGICKCGNKRWQKLNDGNEVYYRCKYCSREWYKPQEKKQVPEFDKIQKAIKELKELR